MIWKLIKDQFVEFSFAEADAKRVNNFYLFLSLARLSSARSFLISSTTLLIISMVFL